MCLHIYPHSLTRITEFIEHITGVLNTWIRIRANKTVLRALAHIIFIELIKQAQFLLIKHLIKRIIAYGQI